MAKIVQVKTKADEDWKEVEVPNFYDPIKHHTVRFEGSTKKVPFAFMQMPDGRIYNKLEGTWAVKERAESTKEVDLSKFEDYTELPYGDESIKLIKADMILQYKDKKDLVQTMEELWRILVPMGRLEITVPYFPNLDALSNPEYLTVFTVDTFSYFEGRVFKHYNQITTNDRLKVVFYK